MTLRTTSLAASGHSRKHCQAVDLSVSALLNVVMVTMLRINLASMGICGTRRKSGKVCAFVLLVLSMVLSVPRCQG